MDLYVIACHKRTSERVGERKRESKREREGLLMQSLESVRVREQEREAG